MSDTESPGTARIMYEREQERLAKAQAQERLEAAAPALLAACEDSFKFLNTLTCFNHDDQQRRMTLVEQAEAAIKAAKGE